MIMLLAYDRLGSMKRLQWITIPRIGFTLIEMLVVMFIVMLLAAVALPTVRQTLQDQKNSRAARSITSFIDVSRSRAIAEAREVGILVERLSENASDTVGTSAGIRIRQLTGVPPYSGESGDAHAVLSQITGVRSGYNARGGSTEIDWTRVTGVNQATFNRSDNQLLAISSVLYSSDDPAVRIKAPIRPFFDRIELPGGKLVTILQIEHDADNVFARFDLREPADSPFDAVYPPPINQPQSTLSIPMGARRTLTPNQVVKYRIHRSPVRSNTAPLNLPRGVAIDFSYSGIGMTGSQFSNASGITNIAVMFGPDGRVTRYIDSSGTQHMPTSQLFFCLGDFAGVRPDDPFANTGRDRANIARDKSSWIVINNQTGRAFAAPMTTVSAATLTTPTANAVEFAAKMRETLREARFLASLSDKVEGF